MPDVNTIYMLTMLIIIVTNTWMAEFSNMYHVASKIKGEYCINFVNGAIIFFRIGVGGEVMKKAGVTEFCHKKRGSQK